MICKNEVAIIYKTPKQQKIQIQAFLDDFEKNGSMCGKMGLRKAWGGSYDFVFHPET